MLYKFYTKVYKLIYFIKGDLVMSFFRTHFYGLTPYSTLNSRRLTVYFLSLLLLVYFNINFLILILIPKHLNFVVFYTPMLSIDRFEF